jgi:hypothetical protein
VRRIGLLIVAALAVLTFVGVPSGCNSSPTEPNGNGQFSPTPTFTPTSLASTPLATPTLGNPVTATPTPVVTGTPPTPTPTSGLGSTPVTFTPTPLPATATPTAAAPTATPLTPVPTATPFAGTPTPVQTPTH